MIILPSASKTFSCSLAASGWKTMNERKKKKKTTSIGVNVKHIVLN